MGNQAKSDALRANVFLVVSVVAVLMMPVTKTAMAKSLYVIADINGEPTPVHAYDIAPDGTLTFQAEYGVPAYDLGAVGLAIDSDSGYLFVTYEDSNLIQLVDATEMTDEGTTTANSTRDLAGIVYDHDKGLLYCVDRGRDRLFVYSWRPRSSALTRVPGSPFTLTGTTPYGIALDELNGLLYVANASNTIHVYSTSDWSLAKMIPVSRIAISVAVDVTNGLLYSGGGFAANHYLTQYDLATDKEAEVQVENDAGVMGLAVDSDTGLVYMSTGSNNKSGGDNLLVFDKSLSLIDIVTDIGNPTGLAIPSKSVSYNPLNLNKRIIRGVIGGKEVDNVEFVDAGDTITYALSFDNKVNNYPITGVTIIDLLPDEVRLITAAGNAIPEEYDSTTHTLKWHLPFLESGSGTTLEFTVQVMQSSRLGTTITNFANIDSIETPPTTMSVGVATTKTTGYNPLNLSKTIAGAVVGETNVDEPMCAGLGDPITYKICFDNNNNDFAVTNVSVIDILPKEVSFIEAKANIDGASGQYDSITHTYTWLYPALTPGTGACLELVARVKEDTPIGTSVTNLANIDSLETRPTTESVTIVTCKSSLKADMSVDSDMIRRAGYPTNILAILKLPYGFGKDDIKDEPLILSPGSIEANRQFVFGTDTRSKIIALFDTAKLLDAVPDYYGEVELKVIGQLKSGRSFSGAALVTITRFTGP